MRSIAYIAVGLLLLIVAIGMYRQPACALPKCALPKTDMFCLIGAIKDCSK